MSTYMVDLVCPVQGLLDPVGSVDAVHVDFDRYDLLLTNSPEFRVQGHGVGIRQ